MRGCYGNVIASLLDAGTSDVAMHLWGANRRRCNGVLPLPNVHQNDRSVMLIKIYVPFRYVLSKNERDNDREIAVVSLKTDDRYTM